MQRKTGIIILSMTLCSLLLAGTVLAAGAYQLNWWTVDSGGGSSQSAGGQYTLIGTVGQPEAGVVTGGGYALNSGFWYGLSAAIREFLIHLPFISR